MTKDKKPDHIREQRTNVQFSCPVAIRDELKQIAEEEDRNLGMQIVKALRSWLSMRLPSGSGGRTSDA